MQMKRSLLTLAVAAFCGMIASAAHGSIVYSYGTDSPTYTGSAGSTVQVQLYAVETLTNGTLSLIVADVGLNGAGSEILRSGSGQAAMTAMALNTTDFNGGSALSTLSITGPKTDFTENVSLAAATGPTGTTTATGRRVFLGTLTITLPSAAGTTNFTIGKNPAGAGSTVTFTNTYNLDANGSSTDAQYGGPGSTAADGNVYSWTGVNSALTSFSVTVPAIPEPASLGLLASAGLLVLRRRRA
jgi:hypothetical protein